ncbi:MAG: DNA-processing protein DprA [Anaerolineaceae bacterium]|nr:DNA-processing protein DprA [Anaerolineaceae bacterium]
MEEKAYWVGFNLVKGIGSVRLQALLDFYGHLNVAWQAPADSLRAAGLSQKIIENLLAIRNKVDLDGLLARYQSQDIDVMTWLDATYPKRLKEIDQPPPVLYLRGKLLPEDDWTVAIVGTRRITSYGRQIAEELSGYLASNGVTVVSGLARGVDKVAHEAALQAGGRTLAVLGSGVDRIYPPEHLQLAGKIMTQGAIVSDYPPGTPPEGMNFPPRNRIISGLSQATVVIEAGETSGALITATFAAEQGREVFSVPGNIHAPQSKGTNRLIRDGARPLLRVEEVLEVLNLQQIQEHRLARTLLPVDDVEACILKVLGDEPLHVDEIRAQAGLPIDKVSATLAMMELKGMVRQVGGMNYVTLRETHSDYWIDPND